MQFSSKYIHWYATNLMLEFLYTLLRGSRNITFLWPRLGPSLMMVYVIFFTTLSSFQKDSKLWISCLYNRLWESIYTSKRMLMVTEGWTTLHWDLPPMFQLQDFKNFKAFQWNNIELEKCTFKIVNSTFLWEKGEWRHPLY